MQHPNVAQIRKDTAVLHSEAGLSRDIRTVELNYKGEVNFRENPATNKHSSNRKLFASLQPDGTSIFLDPELLDSQADQLDSEADDGKADVLHINAAGSDRDHEHSIVRIHAPERSNPVSLAAQEENANVAKKNNGGMIAVLVSVGVVSVIIFMFLVRGSSRCRPPANVESDTTSDALIKKGSQRASQIKGSMTQAFQKGKEKGKAGNVK